MEETPKEVNKSYVMKALGLALARAVKKKTFDPSEFAVPFKP